MLAARVAVNVVSGYFVAAMAFAVVKNCPRFRFTSLPVRRIFVAYCSSGAPVEFGAPPLVHAVEMLSN